MLQSTGWGVSQISSPIDNCTQWDLDLAQFSFIYALIDSPSADLICLLEDCAPPGMDVLFFVYIQAQQPLPRVRTRIEVLLLLYCYYCSFEIKRGFGGKMVLCHCMCGWSLPFFTEVTCICVHNLLIACGFIAKIDNKIIIILIGKVLFNKFIGHLFPSMHV